MDEEGGKLRDLEFEASGVPQPHRDRWGRGKQNDDLFWRPRSLVRMDGGNSRAAKAIGNHAMSQKVGVFYPMVCTVLSDWGEGRGTGAGGARGSSRGLVRE
jgi:hypothetical protein